MADDLISVHRKSYSLHQKLLNLTSRFGNIVGHKVNIQILMAFLYTNTEISGKKTMKKVHYYSNKKNKVPRNKFNQGSKRPILRKL